MALDASRAAAAHLDDGRESTEPLAVGGGEPIAKSLGSEATGADSAAAAPGTALRQGAGMATTPAPSGARAVGAAEAKGGTDDVDCSKLAVRTPLRVRELDARTAGVHCRDVSRECGSKASAETDFNGIGALAAFR